jgi:hypothetical protein
MNISSTAGTSVLSDLALNQNFEGSFVRITALRRGLITDLQRIEEMLHNTVTGDPLTEELTIWHREFREALNTHLDVSLICDRFVDLAQRILIDSLTQAPLDSEVFLGSDGYCYGMKTLCVFENSVQETYRFRSPLNLQDPDQDEFFVVPHELARHILMWLESRSKRLEGLPEIEKAFEDLITEMGINKVTRLIPTKRNNRIRRIHQEEQLRNQHQTVTQVMEVNFALLEKEVKAEIKKEFGELAQKVDQSAKEVLDKLDRIESVQNIAYLEMDRRITRLENEQQGVQSDIEELENEISYVSGEIVDAKKEQLQVEQSIKKVEAAIEKRKKDRKNRLIGTIAVIGCCLLGTVLVQQLFASASLLPVNGNGISIIVKI